MLLERFALAWLSDLSFCMRRSPTGIVTCPCHADFISFRFKLIKPQATCLYTRTHNRLLIHRTLPIILGWWSPDCLLANVHGCEMKWYDNDMTISLTARHKINIQSIWRRGPSLMVILGGHPWWSSFVRAGNFYVIYFNVQFLRFIKQFGSRLSSNFYEFVRFFRFVCLFIVNIVDMCLVVIKAYLLTYLLIYLLT